jgi:tetratricopeptide (TPR) repeat protein
MKTFFRIWTVTIAIGIWLFCTQSANAFDARNCHLTPSTNSNSQAIVTQLSEVALSRLKAPHAKAKYLASQNSSSGACAANCFRLPGQLGIDGCRCALHENPGNAAVWNNLGQKLFNLGRYSDALIAYDHALLIHPFYSLGLANRCGVLSQLEEYTQALASCDLALAGDGNWGEPGAAIAWDNRGDALFNLQRYQEALDSFERALSTNPSYQNAQRNRAIVLRRLEQLTKQQAKENDD